MLLREKGRGSCGGCGVEGETELDDSEEQLKVDLGGLAESEIPGRRDWRLLERRLRTRARDAGCGCRLRLPNGIGAEYTTTVLKCERSEALERVRESRDVRRRSRGPRLFGRWREPVRDSPEELLVLGTR